MIGGDSNKRYYEAAPECNWLLGVGVRYQFQVGSQLRRDLAQACGKRQNR